MTTKQREQRQWVETILRQIQGNEFFGKIIISFESGMIQRIMKEESLKPPTDNKNSA